MLLDYKSILSLENEGTPFHVSSFYERKFTIGEITNRPRKVYHHWKSEGLIPSYFGADYWLNYQYELGVDLEEASWERFNFIEASWIKMVDILRDFNYPKERIKRMAEIYFGVDEERKKHFRDIMIAHKMEIGRKLESLLKNLGSPEARLQAKNQLRDLSSSFTFGRFDELTLQSIYQREPFIFVASKLGGLIPLVEGEKSESAEHEAFMNEVKSQPHLIIPYYKILESMLFDEQNAHFAKVITGLSVSESKIIKAIREKKIREVTISKTDDREKIILRQTERQIISREDEARLIKLFTNRKYKVLNTSHIEGGCILIDLELKETLQVKD